MPATSLQLQIATWCVAVGIAAATPAAAQSICVKCNDPVETYSCSLSPQTTTTANVGRRGLQYRCIQEIARRYGHGQCAISDTRVGDCIGKVHMVAGVPPAAAASGAPPQASAAPVPAAGDPSRVPSRRDEEPRTVVELAKRTAAETEEELRRSGRTVTKAAKSTWRCVVSLFSDC